MNPPTWAKNATPPPFAEALNSPKLASMSWYKDHSPEEDPGRDPDQEDREDPGPAGPALDSMIIMTDD